MAPENTNANQNKKEKEIYVGAVIEINEQPINLIPSTPVNQIDKRGLKLALDKPVELGELSKAMDSLCKDMGIESNPLSEQKLKEIESPLFKNIATKIATANMRIEALKYEQPPVKDKDGTAIEPPPLSKYVFVASVNWGDNTSKNGGGEATNQPKEFFKLRGLILGISSGFTSNETGENPEVQKAFLSALQAIPSVAALPPVSDNQTTSENGSTSATEPETEPEEKAKSKSS